MVEIVILRYVQGMHKFNCPNINMVQAHVYAVVSLVL